MPSPLDYLAELDGLPAQTVDQVVRQNTAELNEPRPV
jgi:hypothetical protein